jgi:type IV pilus assembly protein PilW
MSANYTRPLRHVRRHQGGFTLVELSVATLIGLFLLGGLLTLVQDMRRTFGTQNQLSQLQDNERLAMTLITDVVQAAGYYPDPAFHTITTSFPAAAPFVSDGQAIAGTRNAAAPGDSITVQFRTASNDGVINCTGNTNLTGGNQTYVNTFSVDALGELTCQLSIGGAVVGAPAVLITGVTNLQILYGVKTNFAIPDNNVDSFLYANQMAGNWGNVICVKVTLTFTNPLAATPGQPPTIPFTRVITVMSRAGVNTT